MFKVKWVEEEMVKKVQEQDLMEDMRVFMSGEHREEEE